METVFYFTNAGGNLMALWCKPAVDGMLTTKADGLLDWIICSQHVQLFGSHVGGGQSKGTEHLRKIDGSIWAGMLDEVDREFIISVLAHGVCTMQTAKHSHYTTHDGVQRVEYDLGDVRYHADRTDRDVSPTS